MECQEEPDSGQSAGVAGHDWNAEDRFYLTNFTYTCPFGDKQSILWNRLYSISSVGQAVNGSYTKEVNNTCKYQDTSLTMVYWTYNATNPLPKCIRKYKESFHNFLSFLPSLDKSLWLRKYLNHTFLTTLITYLSYLFNSLQG